VQRVRSAQQARRSRQGVVVKGRWWSREYTRQHEWTHVEPCVAITFGAKKQKPPQGEELLQVGRLKAGEERLRGAPSTVASADSSGLAGRTAEQCREVKPVLAEQVGCRNEALLQHGDVDADLVSCWGVEA
jgi:hypothetical protein